jgi:serine/threonine protein kinase
MLSSKPISPCWNILSCMNNPKQHIGPYTVNGELGRGGMGVVYKATDSRLNRPVAIKSLHDQMLANPENLARLEREARALAALNHPNIAGIHGVEQEGDHYFLILEFVDGETLDERLSRNPMPIAEVLEICTQIAAALEAAHEAGIVHRDLKPANIKITPDGQVKVLDFGLASMNEATPTSQPTDQTIEMATAGLETTPGTLLGTIPYMSPEQARGNATDQRSDIWSLAVIVYECLTGSNPFSGRTPSDTIASILTSEIDLTILPAATPPLITALLKRCLQHNVQARLRDAGDLRLLFADCQGTVPATSEAELKSAAIVEKTFLIDDEACRNLEKDGFDPHLMGWQMQYADNQRASDVLQVWIPSFGEDHSMGIWRDVLTSSPYRTIVATPIGMEPKATYRPRISMANQLTLLRRLVASAAESARPSRVIVGGFS